MVDGHHMKVTLRHLLLVIIFLSCEKVAVIGERSGGSAIEGDAGDHREYVAHHTSSLNKQSSLQQEESLRKEMVKVQILQRLGLNEKPKLDLSKQISRDLVIETLRRTENYDQDDPGTSSFRSSSTLNSSHHGEDDSAGSYAKTSEIISFPDKGT